MKLSTRLSLITLLLGLSLTLSAQKTDLQIKDYAQWQNLGTYTVTDDGNWVAWHISLVEGDDTLYIKNLETEKDYKYPLSSQPAFSSDSKWISMQIHYSEKEQEKMREGKKEIKNKVRLLNLETGKERVFNDVQSSEFTDDGKHLLMRTYAEKGVKTNDITLCRLENGILKNLGNIKEYSVNKAGDRLAYIVDVKGSLGNAVELFNLDTYTLRTIDSDTTSYSGLRWEKEGKAFSFLKEFPDTAYKEMNHRVFAVRDIYGTLTINSFNPLGSANIPGDMRVRETYTPTFSDDMSILYFGVYEWTRKESKEDKKKDKEKLPGVDIWHWKDDPIQPNQQVTYPRSEANFTYMFAWNINSGKIVRISDDELQDPRISGNGMKVLVRSDKAYRPQFRTPLYDHYLVDPTTGEKKEILKGFSTIYGSSPEGKFLYYFKDKAWWLYNVENNKHTNMTGSLDTDFWNTRDDLPKDIKPPFGFGGWLKDDVAMLVYDEYDVWKVPANGTPPEKLTEGKASEIIHRVTRLDYEEDYLDAAEDLYISLTGDKSKWSGYGKISPKGKYKELIYKDMAIGGLRKAKNADRFLYTEQSYSDSPDIFVSGAGFGKASQVSATNLQQEKYHWGRSELIEYTNRDGKKMQGALYYPANYQEGKKYPMIVYIYEIRSTGLHRYVSPSDESAYNTTNYTTSGYFIFQPDIVYKTNHPGESAVDCVVPAVEEVLKTGMIDKDKIGLMGHSWGAYQTSFIITQTDLFSAAVAGAPLINMISMYNEIYWNSGSPNQNIFETSQGRLREPWWDLMKEYMDNSPMFNADKITTPLLVAFGNKDGAVDWHQGIEMFTTMRRMEKPYIMLVYEGENHGLRQKENMKDYCQKTREFFEHHLLGNEAAEWIVKGKTYMQKKKEEELNEKK
ncbi:MAG: prolyl oligopeptidase family serine peptidase [Marinilabiliaceae bacterium]|jgi:dipeptidyl aminopeptidase/acylaminoacyl peptidase|nr:prolyl oligopeptidase family serine peptidase [Marinilabiliaceae bacterium]